MTQQAIQTIPKNELPVRIEANWDTARAWLDSARRMEQGKLFCQVMFGFTLQALHREHGIQNGSKAHLSQNGKGWEDILKAETGLPTSTAYRYIDMAKAALPRLKKLSALRGFDPGAQALASLPAPQQEALTSALKKITDGATQREFGEQCGLWKKPQGSGATGRAKGEGGRKKLTLGEQAELLKLQATEDWKGIEKSLRVYTGKFCALTDEDVLAQTAELERALMARRTWLKQPHDKRDPKAIAALFEQ